MSVQPWVHDAGLMKETSLIPTRFKSSARVTFVLLCGEKNKELWD